MKYTVKLKDSEKIRFLNTGNVISSDLDVLGMITLNY